ncbi:hypothetical protein [Streptomyces sp. NPDC054962]
MAAIAVQMCLIYMVSGLYKVQGEVWQDGTALFYIMRVPEFELPGWSSLVYDNDVLVFLGTYSSILFLVYFPMGTWWRGCARGRRRHPSPSMCPSACSWDSPRSP